MKRFLTRSIKGQINITKKNIYSIQIQPVDCELCCIASDPARILSWWPNRGPGWRVGGAGAGGRGRSPPAPVPAPSARGWGCSGPHSPRLYTPNIQCCRLWQILCRRKKGRVWPRNTYCFVMSHLMGVSREIKWFWTCCCNLLSVPHGQSKNLEFFNAIFKISYNGRVLKH
jgi:hypothetical protein